MKEQIIEALEKLDVENDDHWTGNGAPLINALGIPNLKRADVTAVAPQFTRDNPVIELPDEDVTEEDVTEEDTSDEEQVVTPPKVEVKTSEDSEPLEITAEVDKKKALWAAVEEAQKGVNEAQANLRDATKEYDKYVDETEGREAGKTNQQDIMNFIKNQTRMRAEKAGKMQAFLDQGFTSVKSPLDQALANKKTGNVRIPDSMMGKDE